MIGLYCCWGAKITGEGFYVSSVNAKYINSFYAKYGKLFLVTNTQSEKVNNDDVYIDNAICEVYKLPEFNNYLKSVRYFFKILKGLYHLSKRSDKIYVKTPDPFCWLLAVFRRKKQFINYHFVSNPLEVIIQDEKRSFFSKCFRFSLYYPEFILTCLGASFNNVSANGPSVCKRVPYFLKYKIRMLIESTITDGELYSKNNNVCRLLRPKKFLCVSRLVPGKGIELLFETIKHLSLKYPSQIEKVIIVGDGPLRQNLEHWITKNKMDHIITMLGLVKNGTELNKIYSSCDIFINPSLSETGPRVIIEAMVEGCFCISTDVGYASYVLSQEGKKYGLITSSKSVEGLLTGIEWTFNNVAEINKMAYEGKKRACQFTLDKFVTDALQHSSSKR